MPDSSMSMTHVAGVHLFPADNKHLGDNIFYNLHWLHVIRLLTSHHENHIWFCRWRFKTLFPCSKTPGHVCEFIYMDISENLNLNLLLKMCYCISNNGFICGLKSNMSLSILLIFYMYFFRNDEYKMSNKRWHFL